MQDLELRTPMTTAEVEASEDGITVQLPLTAGSWNILESIDAETGVSLTMATRTVMTFTPREFSSFCDELLAHRLVLHEVTRVPHFEPETVL